MATTAVYAWNPVGSNQHAGSALSAEAPKSNKELAAIGGVGVRSIEQSKAVQTNAAPEVIAAVNRGDLGLPKAAAIAKLPPEQQAQAMKGRARRLGGAPWCLTWTWAPSAAPQKRA